MRLNASFFTLVLCSAAAFCAVNASLTSPHDTAIPEGMLRASSLPATVASAVNNGGSWSVVPGRRDDAVAVAEWSDAVETTGWAFLNVTTNPKNGNDRDQMYAAGLVEGAVTSGRIYQAFLNNGGHIDLGLIQDIYLGPQQEWVKSQIDAHPYDPFWYHVDLTQTQVQGLADGYNMTAKADEPMLYEDILVLNIGNDLETLASVFTYHPMSGWAGQDHCSGLVKVLPNFADIFISQVTWSSFNSMLRIYKKYDFSVSVNGKDTGVVPGRVTKFSSYPGTLFSGDDYYTSSAGLVIFETTIGNSNPALWKYVTPKTVLEFYRNVVANRLANSGKEWSFYFSTANSGTYNNEFFILDYKLFTPGHTPKPNTLWLLDQVPGHIHAADITDELVRKMYHPSYNSPYWPDIFNVSGGPEEVAKYGEWFSYDKTPRALIFARDHHKVVDIKSMMSMMRYNDFRNDPLSRCDCEPYPYSAENAISCRDDLNVADGKYPFAALGQRNHAGIDAKMTSYKLFKEDMASLAISSPSYDQQPVFEFSTSPYANISHVGLPDRWEFDWVAV